MVGGLAALFGGALLLQQTSAAPGNFSITGASSVQNGSNITVSVRVNPGTPIDAIEATLAYDQSKLQYVSTNTAGSAFPLELPGGAGGAGTVSLVRFISPGTVTGDGLIAQITFKALTGSGSTNLQASGTGALAGAATTPDNGSKTISLTTPVTPSPTTPSPSPSRSSPNPKPNPSPTPPSSGGSSGSGSSGGNNSGGGSSSGGGSANNGGGSSTGTPVKVDVKKKRIEYTRAIFNMISSTKFRVYMKYGLQNQLVAQTQQTGFSNEHDVTLDPSVILPGTTFYYQVIAEDEQGNTTEMPVETFKTKGYRVRMFLVDKYEKPLRNKAVVLHSDPVNGKTDENGVVEFEDVAPGNHNVDYKQDGKTYSQPVTVNPFPIKTTDNGDQDAETIQQLATFKELAVVENRPSLILPASVAAAIAVVAVAAYVFLKRRQKLAFSWPGSGRPTGGVTGGGPSDTFQPPQDSAGSLVDKVSGLQRPDPGSVVTPHPEDDKDKK